MTRITNNDLEKKILKHRTEEAMRLALRQFINQEHELHIPPDSEDADMVISDVIEELLEARKKLSLLEPLRDALISEHAWQEALRDPGKTLDAMIRPLHPVETPIRDAIKVSAMTTREEAEQAANAELESYMSLPTSSFLHQIPVEMQGSLNTEPIVEELGRYFECSDWIAAKKKGKENALYLIDLGGYYGSENLEVLREEQEDAH